VQDITDRYYETSVFKSGWFTQTSTPMSEVTIDDIPVEDRLRIAQDLRTLRGGTEPSEDAILRVFIRTKMSE
jgi:hypothetical protein